MALYDLHDEFDYDFWDSYVFKIQRTPLEARSSGILKKLDYLFAMVADPGVWLFTKPDYETRDREYWLMDELDISIMNGDKGEAAAVTLRIAHLLRQTALHFWELYQIAQPMTE